MFKGNSQRLEQVVINLIVNACESLQDKSRSVSISTRFDAADDRVIVQVKDEGVGIQPEALQRIRDPFFTTKRDSGGTGLGLTISDKIVRDHRGELIFESEPDSGTTVTIRLPIKPEEEDRELTFR
jgi:polar amino acid transport system substrate-binding protein